MPTASAELRTELEASNAQYAEQRAARVELLSQLKAERESIFGNVGAVQDQFDANEEAITQNRAKAQVLENIVKALDDTTESETEATESARLAGIVQKVLQESIDATTESMKELAAEAKTLTEIYTGLTASVKEYSDLIALTASAGAADFFRLARGEIEGYTGDIDTAICICDRSRSRT